MKIESTVQSRLPKLTVETKLVNANSCPDKLWLDLDRVIMLERKFDASFLADETVFSTSFPTDIEV